ncbi:hypothetical protein F5878DRAFT_667126 [Lentinula raphanica]|uniref:Uncharacterized protein n=1 Tax=Lentinula raphanica TaxID=153919 RepID=A0AA38U3U3_9AGAR|nr:hypothetical protein F5878DRAFT_667126 [Lentinula raphanica]
MVMKTQLKRFTNLQIAKLSLAEIETEYSAITKCINLAQKKAIKLAGDIKGLEASIEKEAQNPNDVPKMRAGRSRKENFQQKLEKKQAEQLTDQEALSKLLQIQVILSAKLTVLQRDDVPLSSKGKYAEPDIERWSHNQAHQDRSMSASSLSNLTSSDINERTSVFPLMDGAGITVTAAQDENANVGANIHAGIDSEAKVNDSNAKSSNTALPSNSKDVTPASNSVAAFDMRPMPSVNSGSMLGAGAYLPENMVIHQQQGTNLGNADSHYGMTEAYIPSNSAINQQQNLDLGNPNPHYGMPWNSFSNNEGMLANEGYAPMHMEVHQQQKVDMNNEDFRKVEAHIA